MDGRAPDHRAFLAALSPPERVALTQRSNRAGLAHLAGHVGIIVFGGVWIAFGLPLWWMLLPVQGVALAFLFTLQHECTHATPFRSGWINTAVGVAAGAVLIQPFFWFRAFHMAHHRFTNDPKRDPELQGSEKPDTRAALARHLSTFGYWRDKIVVLLELAAGRAEADYIAPRARARIVTEARALVLVYTAAAVFTIMVSPVLFWVWLLPLAFGFPVLRLYLLAEHGRCPAVADMFENSRTTLTNRVVRFLAWNMPYHAEHHAYPAVPFHRLPALHDRAKAELKCVTPGYRQFASDYVGAMRAG